MKIFVSYRCDDEPGIADRLCEVLKAEFGKDNVFFDVDADLAGDRFQERIDEAIRVCDWFIPVVGQFWLVDRNGVDRVAARVDYVRMELSAALSRHPALKVFPVLVGNVDIGRLSNSGSPYSAILDFDYDTIQFGKTTRDDIARVVKRVSGSYSQPEITEAALEAFFLGNVGWDAKRYAISEHGAAARNCFLSSILSLANHILSNMQRSGSQDKEFSDTLVKLVLAGNASLRYYNAGFVDNAAIRLFGSVPSLLLFLRDRLRASSEAALKSGNTDLANSWEILVKSIGEFRVDYIEHFMRNHESAPIGNQKLAAGVWEVTEYFPDDPTKVESVYPCDVEFLEDHLINRLKVQVGPNGDIRTVPNQSISGLQWNWIQSGRKIAIFLPQPYKTFWGWLRRFDSEFEAVKQFEVQSFDGSKGIVPSSKLQFVRI